MHLAAHVVARRAIVPLQVDYYNHCARNAVNDKVCSKHMLS